MNSSRNIDDYAGQLKSNNDSLRSIDNNNESYQFPVIDRRKKEYIKVKMEEQKI